VASAGGGALQAGAEADGLQVPRTGRAIDEKQGTHVITNAGGRHQERETHPCLDGAKSSTSIKTSKPLPWNPLPVLEPARMNPKALPRHQLLGSLNLDTREWTDGVLTAAARKVGYNPAGLAAGWGGNGASCKIQPTTLPPHLHPHPLPQPARPPSGPPTRATPGSWQMGMSTQSGSRASTACWTTTGGVGGVHHVVSSYLESSTHRSPTSTRANNTNNPHH
jgi:hypothetical protein